MSFEFNGLGDFRYFITKPHNEIKYSICVGLGLPPEMSTTYKTLIEEHKKRLISTSKSSSVEQVVKNHLSALRGFLKSVEKSDSSQVGLELTSDFEKCHRLHIAESKLGQRAVSDRRSLLNAWKLTFDLIGGKPDNTKSSRERRSSKTIPENQNPFELALRSALGNANLSAKGAARRAGISPSALGRWTRGALPNIRSVQSLRKLEKVLDLPPNSLTTALTSAISVVNAAVPDEARIRRGQRTQSPYRLKVNDMSDDLRKEWQAYFEYKTITKPPCLKRGLGARWSLVDPDDSSTITNDINSRDGKVSPSAQKTWGLFAAFFGFLVLPKSAAGYGLPKEVPISLAWLAVPEAIDAFLEFYTTRSGGEKHGGQHMLSTVVASLVKPRTGYLLQQPEFAARLPDTALNGRSWGQMCEQTHELSLVWISDSTGKSRNPADALRYFLSQDYPLAPIFSIMKKLRAEAEAAPANSKPEAIARRDELILGLLVSNPLRAVNLTTMTYKVNNSGELYKDGKGAWRIRIPGRKFKNRKRVGRQTYDVPVAGWLAAIFSDYVNVFRPILLAGKVDKGFLFLSSSGDGKLNNLGARVFKVVKLYLPESGGISAHAFRHLVATDWLTRFPNDFVTVAEILNDTIAVVIKSYAHLKKDTSFMRYEEHVQSMQSM